MAAMAPTISKGYCAGAAANTEPQQALVLGHVSHTRLSPGVHEACCRTSPSSGSPESLEDSPGSPVVTIPDEVPGGSAVDSEVSTAPVEGPGPLLPEDAPVEPKPVEPVPSAGGVPPSSPQADTSRM